MALPSRIGLSALLASLAAGCAVGPDYKQPETKSPDQFVATDATQVASADVEADFWKAFNDQELNALIEEALAANHDIRIAMANLKEARAIRGEARLDFAPTVTASGGYTESRLSERESFGFARNQNFYDAGFDAFWEIGLSPWDTAAGTLLIQEAGGRIGTLGGAEYRQEGHVLAGTPKVYAALLEAFAPHVPVEMRAS